MADDIKEKLDSLVEDIEESPVNQNSFRGLSILYITNFCETKKISSNASTFSSSKFPEKQEVRTKLGALKIIFQRGCALNNQGQKLFQLGCALNQDIYGTHTNKRSSS